jgi:hypothetical protein
MSGFTKSGYPIPHRAFEFVTNNIPNGMKKFLRNKKKICDIALYKDGKCTHKEIIKIKSSPEASGFFQNEQQADMPLISICSVYDFLF